MELRKVELKNTYEDFDRFVFANKGDEIEGTLVDAKQIVPKVGNPFMRYIVDTKQSGKVSFLGCYQIDRYMETIKDGDYFKLEYKGKTNFSSDGKVKSFKSFDFYTAA